MRLFCLLTLAVGMADPPDQSLKERLDPILEHAVQQQGLPGFAIAVVEKGKIAYARGFGVRNLDGRDDPVTPETLFHMASITKTFVATSVMQLVEQGKVDLNAPLVRYLPYFKLNDDRYREITVRQMLSHISGMPDVKDYEWDKPQYDGGALERYVRSIAGYAMIAAPGTKFQYSNMAYEVLGDLVSKISGVSFEEYVKRNILQPLAMSSSTLLLKEAGPKLLASPHVRNDSRQVVVSKVFPYNRMHSPSSTLYSNVLDMGRWAIANLNRGELDGHRIVKASTYDLMWTPAAAQWPHIGISWFLGTHKGYATVGHSGGDTGFSSNLSIIPSESLAVVMMSNYDRADLRGITSAVLTVALELAR